MAAIFGSVVTAICLGVQGSYGPACNGAVDAGTRQLGIRQQIDNAEDKSVELTSKVIAKALGKQAMSVVATGGYIYRVAKERSIGFNLPTLKICDSLSNQITLESYKLNFEWRLP